MLCLGGVVGNILELLAIDRFSSLVWHLSRIVYRLEKDRERVESD
jgi:hypothetical protein